MEKAPNETVTLENIGQGAAMALFEAELEKVNNNIADINTKAKKERKVIIEVSIIPDETRKMLNVGISATSKLAPHEGVATMAYLGKDKGTGKNMMVEHNPVQDRFNFGQPEGVTGINEKEGTND